MIGRTRPRGSGGGFAGFRLGSLLLLGTACAVAAGCQVQEGGAGVPDTGERSAGTSVATSPRLPGSRSEPDVARERGIGTGSGSTETVPVEPSIPGARDRPDLDPARRAGAQVDESRRTAIVRAANRVSPAVVSVNVIRTQRTRPRSIWEDFFLPPGSSRRIPGLGSGFIYDPSGLVITNEHVVRDAERIMVTLPDGRDFEAELVGTDDLTDIAVLRIEGRDLPVAPIGTSDGLLIGEWTVAIGNPYGFLLSSADPTVTAGVVSAVDRHIIQSDDEQRGIYVGMIQTDAPINPGNSGGPLVNALGEVVGVNSSILSRSGGSVGLGFAIPIDRAVRIAFDLVSNGSVRRAWTGIDVEPEEADPWGRTRGVLVSRVAPGSPAERSGVREGDRLVSGDGRPLANPFDYEALILDHRAGDVLTLGIEGRGAPIELQAESPPTVRAERVRILQELELITVTPAVRAERNVQSERGALVVGISENLSRQLGLRENDVLLQINDRRIGSAEDAANVFRAVAGSGTVRIYFERNGGVSVRTFYWGR